VIERSSIRDPAKKNDSSSGCLRNEDLYDCASYAIQLDIYELYQNKIRLKGCIQITRNIYNYCTKV
jgi:hypothetical protein